MPHSALCIFSASCKLALMNSQCICKANLQMGLTVHFEYSGHSSHSNIFDPSSKKLYNKQVKLNPNQSINFNNIIYPVDNKITLQFAEKFRHALPTSYRLLLQKSVTKCGKTTCSLITIYYSHRASFKKLTLVWVPQLQLAQSTSPLFTYCI